MGELGRALKTALTIHGTKNGNAFLKVASLHHEQDE